MPYLIALLLSAVGVRIVHPYLVKFALDNNVVDKPNARKLNRVPVPVLGGVGVFVGFAIALYIVAAVVHIRFPYIYTVVLLLMLGVGLVDDLYDLKPRTKFAAQILAVLLLYFVCDLRIDNLHGVFGIYEVPVVVSFPLTIIACVGLINSFNLIDGIDGLSSGYSIVASALFVAWTCVQSNSINLLISCALIGALVPFFIYNVFGKCHKMFIGDAGEVFIHDAAWLAGVAPPKVEITIHTLEGDMTASVGDYIITGVHVELYPCKPDIFEQTYEKVED